MSLNDKMSRKERMDNIENFLADVVLMGPSSLKMGFRSFGGKDEEMPYVLVRFASMMNEYTSMLMKEALEPDEIERFAEFHEKTMTASIKKCNVTMGRHVQN